MRKVLDAEYYDAKHRRFMIEWCIEAAVIVILALCLVFFEGGF